MSTVTKTLYETDFVEWADHTAELLRQGKFDEVDWEHLVEEVEGLSGSERSAVSSQLYRMLKHLVKQQIQPERRGKSWIVSIKNARFRVKHKLRQSPGLRRYADDELAWIWQQALHGALAETGLTAQNKTLGIPEKCPWPIDQLLEGTADNLRWE
jgi:hypothetical protein